MTARYLYNVSRTPVGRFNGALSGVRQRSGPQDHLFISTAALRDAHLLCRTLAHFERGPADLAVALRSAEAEFRATGYSALRKAVRIQHSGLNAGWLGVAGARALLRTAQRIPALRRAIVPYRDQARPRPWECDG